MKKISNIFILALVLLLSLNACMERSTYEINGVAEGLEDGFEVELRNAQTRESIAKTTVKDGKFYFEGSVEQAHKATVNFGRMYHTLVLENAVYKFVKGKCCNYADGGIINNHVYGYTLEPEFQQMMEEHRIAPSPFEGLDMMNKEAVEKARKISRARMNKEWDYRNAYYRKILNSDQPTLIKLFVLSEISDWKNYDLDRKLELYNEYEKELGQHPLLVQNREGVLRAKKTREIQASVAPGKPFKEVIGQNKEGNSLKLSEVIAQNKYTLLEMWASWCGPCRGEFPHLKKAYGHYHKRGFEIYALSLDTKEQAWFKALEEENVPWVNVVDYRGFEGDGPQKYGVKGIPSSFLIDQNGTIVASGQDVRGFGLDEKLEELLGK